MTAAPAPDRPSTQGACRIYSTPSNFFDTHTGWAPLVALGARQHAVLTVAQVRAAGLSPATISAYVGDARLHRIHHGVYALTPAQLLTPHGRLMAAVIACGPLAALSFQPAARLHGLLGYGSARPHVTVPTTGGRRRPQIQIHRSSTLRPGLDTTTVEGIPCTSAHRTIFDLASVLNPRQLERVLDQALTVQLLDINALHDQIDHNRGRSANVAALARVLATHEIGSTPTWNEFEERFLAIVRATGLPAPEVQPYLDLHDGAFPIKPDFLWRAERVIVETDGWRFHGGPQAFEDDRRRDQRTAVAGYRTIRTTWRQVTRESMRLQSTLLAVVTGVRSAAGPDAAAA